RVHVAARRDRRCAPGGSRSRAPGAGGRDQRADHLLLCAVVEYAAPGCIGQHHGALLDGLYDANRHAHHVARRVAVLVWRQRASRARHHSRARAGRRTAAGGCPPMSWSSPGEFFAMGGYAFYVWGSYAVAALCIGGELWWLARSTRAARSRLVPKEPES